MSPTFDAIVVAYNTTIQSIACLNELLRSSVVHRIIICDNSTEDGILAQNQKIANEPRFSKVQYIPMGGNQGLAKAYNIGVRKCMSDYIIIFDDDTTVPAEYMAGIIRYCSTVEADIYVPIVRSRDIIMSPCLKVGLSFRPLREVSELNGHAELSAINSGMVVRRRFYDVCQYDERLFVDAIDHRFMDDARQAHAHIVVMRDVWLIQHYSQEIFDEHSQVARLKIRAKDNRVYYDSNLFSRIYCALMIQYWKFSLAKKYRNANILFLDI